MTPTALANLIDALRVLPGVGPKSAARMAYHLLQRERAGAARLAAGLAAALERLKPCARCNNYSETEVCDNCADPRRDPRLLCVVEMPVDLNRMEETHAYKGLYFVLMGRLSPLDGVGPRDIGLDRLLARDKQRQELLLPISFEASHDEARVLNERAALLERLAIAIEGTHTNMLGTFNLVKNAGHRQ
ncbi:MAG: recombination protein RecR, partial [Thiobacillus sp.]|nr:recombination protein RecR [Thiobacillus sp.]